MDDFKASPNVALKAEVDGRAVCSWERFEFRERNIICWKNREVFKAEEGRGGHQSQQVSDPYVRAMAFLWD